VRVAAFRQSANARLLVGLEGRARVAIGAQRSATAAAEPTFDLAGGPVALVVAGPVAVFAEAGPSVLRLAASGTHLGLAAVAGLGSAF
jgi:hypothetical protein